MIDDLELAFRMADAADVVTLQAWKPTGVRATLKVDGSPVTEADVAAEDAMLQAVRRGAPADAFLGEELGEHPGSSGRRWIVDGIDGTRFYAAGARTWGTLVALEVDGTITVAVISSPAQDRRWWAARGHGAFTGNCDKANTRRLCVSEQPLDPHRLACLPTFDTLQLHQQHALAKLAGGRPADAPWSHQCLVADGQLAACVWFAGDIWDHAAPSLIVEEAGGRFSDHAGGNRLDTRTAIYSNGRCHDDLLTAVRTAIDPT